MDCLHKITAIAKYAVHVEKQYHFLHFQIYANHTEMQKGYVQKSSDFLKETLWTFILARDYK